MLIWLSEAFMANKYQSVRGMSDILPGEAAKFSLVIKSFRALAKAAGYGQIATPIVEDSELFRRTVGEGTDIVSKELYEFEDQPGGKLALRPESTAPVVRAYLEHGMASLPKPVKLYYVGQQMFRRERPQAGRNRQHYQVGVEALGDESPSLDAQIIMLALRFYRRLGVGSVALQLNSIGDEACRPKYIKTLTEYLEGHRKNMCESCNSRLHTNPLRVLDCKSEGCQGILDGAPQVLNYLCKPCHAHFKGVLEYLDELEVPYDLNHRLVRGLDYYNRTVFEFYGQREGAQSSIGAGGRYDGLAEQLGGNKTPGIGFGIGIERVLLELEGSGVQLPEVDPPTIFVASLGEPARIDAFRLIEQLLDNDISAVGSVEKDGIQSQLSKANRTKAPYAVIIGQKEVFDKSVILRDMKTGAQENIPRGRIMKEIQSRLEPSE